MTSTYSAFYIRGLEEFIQNSLLPPVKGILSNTETNPQHHITFCYYGRNFNATENFKVSVSNGIINLPLGERTVTVNEYEIFNTRRGKLLVAKLCVSDAIIDLRKKIYDTFNIKDRIATYNPHITLGSVTGFNGNLPEIPKNSFVISGVTFQ